MLKNRKGKKLESYTSLNKREKKKKHIISKYPNLQKVIERSKLSVKERLRQSRAKRKALIHKINLENKSCRLSDTDGTIFPLIIFLQFPNRGSYSRKRKKA